MITGTRPAPSHPELEPRQPWWRRRWGSRALTAGVVLVFVGPAIYSATRPSEREQSVEDLADEIWFSESDTEQIFIEAEELGVGEEFEELTRGDLNDGYLSDVEISAARKIFTWSRDTEDVQMMEFPDESAFTDSELRSITERACEIARAPDSPLPLLARREEAVADEPHPLAAAFFSGIGTNFSCLDAAAEAGFYD